MPEQGLHLGRVGAALAEPGGNAIQDPLMAPFALTLAGPLQRLHDVRVTVLPVDGDGLLDPATLDAALDPTELLGVSSATLYNHVPDLRELRAAGRARASAELPA